MEIFFTSNIIILSPKEGIYFDFNEIYLKTDDFLYMSNPTTSGNITINANSFMIVFSQEVSLWFVYNFSMQVKNKIIICLREYLEPYTVFLTLIILKREITLFSLTNF